MKDDYKHEQMSETLIVKIFPELKQDLKDLIKRTGKRFKSPSHAARSAIIYALNQRTFTEFDGWYDTLRGEKHDRNERT